MRYFYFLVFIVFFASDVAWAQERPQRPSNDGWIVTVGGGGIYSPKYRGDDEYDLVSVPYIRIEKGERFSATVQDGARYAVIDRDGFKAGPVAKIDFGRNEDGSSGLRITGGSTDDLIGLGDIDTTVELGGFASYRFGDIELKAEAGKGLGGHNGVTGDIGLRYKTKIIGYGPPLIVSLGPSIELADNDYVNEYFGVDPVQSVASGLPEYTASGGIVSYGLGGTAILPLSNKISATFIVNVKRLSGDAADAPLVVERGSRDQAFVGAFLAYQF